MQWLVERRKRLTASKVGGIAKMKNSTKNTLSTFRGNEATRYGSEKEEEIIQQYINHQIRNGHPDLSVDHKSGLSISPGLQQAQMALYMTLVTQIRV